ncbi:MAG: hypothetical protein IPH17_04880 [Bacteroidales bacterium]|nr:hypothetical protein [Bacteroidales bacterium]
MILQKNVRLLFRSNDKDENISTIESFIRRRIITLVVLKEYINLLPLDTYCENYRYRDDELTTDTDLDDDAKQLIQLLTMLMSLEIKLKKN